MAVDVHGNTLWSADAPETVYMGLFAEAGISASGDVVTICGSVWGSKDGFIWVHDGSGDLLQKFEVRSEAAEPVSAVSPSGKYVVMAHDAKVRLFEVVK